MASQSDLYGPLQIVYGSIFKYFLTLFTCGGTLGYLYKTKQSTKPKQPKIDPPSLLKVQSELIMFIVNKLVFTISFSIMTILSLTLVRHIFPTNYGLKPL